MAPSLTGQVVAARHTPDSAGTPRRPAGLSPSGRRIYKIKEWFEKLRNVSRDVLPTT
jgi:hypothetical protein